MNNKLIKKGIILLLACILVFPVIAQVSHTTTSKMTSCVPCLKLFTRATNTSNKDIVDVASSDNRFQTLVTALKAADLVDTLKGPGPFTVFAPTNEAFAKLPAGTLDNLLKPENKSVLADILKYHVTPGKLTAADVTKLANQKITMANGDQARIEVKDGKVYINGAQIIVTDIMAKNGVIHAIDAVILPPND